ncbi:MAG: RHS repeat-associated core domain-containing protein [Lentisphaerae bacterium]|nr:RHS repeat-associated core domain-containing protein [Lentisphaerota bacterium]
MRRFSTASEGLTLETFVSNSAFLYTYDGNGNVSELLGTVNGELRTVGHYEYSPFGELVAATGPEAFDNPYRFSTKRAEDNTGLVLYEYRPYSPSLGRWLSRDPIWEKDGRLNLYEFVKNAPIFRIDKLGLDITDIFFTHAPKTPHGSIEAVKTDGTMQGICDPKDPRCKWFQSNRADWGYVEIGYGTDWATRHAWATTEGWTDFSKVPASTLVLNFSTFVKGTVTVKGCCPSKTLNVSWSVTAAISPAMNHLQTQGQVGSEPPVVAVGSNSQVSDARTFPLDISSCSASFAIDLGSTWRDIGDPVVHSGSGAVDAFVSCKY